MSKLEALKQIATKPQLAALLGVKAQTLTHVLYVLKPATQYTRTTIPKKNGGTRIILSPSDKLKRLQSALSNLLLDCIDEINEKKHTKSSPKRALSHGFVRERSIITNAAQHLNKKNVLNIDLTDFFDSFNFGRVRGFFVKNNHFRLDPHIATVIAQIACYDNKLPQGSPCSPVITNLITHSLDIRLASLAKKYSCLYSRYADDLTFSTRKLEFPRQIMAQEEGQFIVGRELKRQIERAGFSINDKKTRIQYKDSRQDVTGLIVNRKPNVKKEYWRTVKSQCRLLFQTGAFIKKTANGDVEGNINELNGQLDFIDQVDRFNRLRQKPPLNPIYKLAQHSHDTTALLTGRERTFSRFLYYRLFYANVQPTILCEGKTDPIYLKAALGVLAEHYPTLARPKVESAPYKLLIRFVNYSRRTRFLLQLYGGTSYLGFFVSKFDKHCQYYKAPPPQHPVIIILDNDAGFSDIERELKKLNSVSTFPATTKKNDYVRADFIHVTRNLYVVLTPLGDNNGSTNIESLFGDNIRLIKHNGKCFNTIDKRDEKVDLSKDAFATHVILAQKHTLSFDSFKPLLDRVAAVISHYESNGQN